MPQYFANGILTKDGQVYRTGSKITLTEEQAKRLGDKVVPIKVVEKPLEDLGVKQLRSLAKDAGIANYSSMDKGTLYDELSAVQTEVSGAPAVDDDEPAGD